MTRPWCLATALLALLACKERSAPSPNQATPPPATQPAAAGSAEGFDPQSLGALRFQVAGGTPEARAQFDRGLLALHSFWYEEATARFTEAIEIDPSFSMAYWGLAMSKAKLLWGDDDVAAGRDALMRMPTPNLLPVREQAWVMASLALFRHAKADVATTRREFLDAMEALHQRFPDDESAVFLSLALLSSVKPNDPNELAIRKRAAALAQEVFERNPKHPGAAHYLIHAYDTPELAPLALPAAELYATIAPAAFHARHMPGHIFVRLGKWKEAQESCQAAWDASVAWVTRDKLTADHKDFHSLSWLIEIGFERGRRSDADRAMELYADHVRRGLGHDKRAAYAGQVASYLGRTGEWDRVDELLAPLDAPAGDAHVPSASQACGHAPTPNASPGDLFEKRAVLATRARAAAMRRDRAAVIRLLAERERVDEELRPFLVSTQGEALVATVERLRPFVRKALIAYAEGNDKALVAALGPLAEDQDTEFVGEGMAGGILHQEEIADAHMRLGNAAAALAAYRAVLATHAGRARSRLGVARAAAKLGNDALAREHYQWLANAWGEAEPNTDGLDEVRRALGR